VYVAPIAIVWNRCPLAPHQPPSQRGVIGWFFGSRTEPGGIRCVVDLLLDARSFMQIGGGDPIPLWEHGGGKGSVGRVADDVLDVCRERMRSHWRIVTGPPKLSRSEILARVMRGKSVAEAVRERAEEKGVGEAVVRKEAERILRGMASDYRCWAVRCMRFFMEYLLTAMFNAVYLDEPGLGVVRRLISENGSPPVIYIPTHKSHMDYLLLSFVLFCRYRGEGFRK
jgi:glycerol-3-phosphate O-acyltransferase